MKAKQILSVLLVVLVLPLLLANKSCERSTTWGPKEFSEWEADHSSFDKDTACVDCHDGRTTDSKPKSHDVSWLRTHGQFSNLKYGFQGESVCIRCHTESTCTKCHMQEEPQNHTEFWKERGHGSMANMNRSSCMSCHKSADFCERCHSSVAPVNHSAAWGSSANRHCLNCHFPLASAGAQECAVCHQSTPSHDNTPARPNNALHLPTANCRDCHSPMRHPDNGMNCTDCHL